MIDLGDRAEDSTIDFCFSTQTLAGTAITLAGTPGLGVYKGNGTTVSTLGVTLSVNFAGVTGRNQVHIDTSAAFYGTASDYSVAITQGTVDAIDVANRIVALFSIENRNRNAFKLYADQSGVTVGTVSNLSTKTGFSLAADQSAVTIGTVNSVPVGQIRAELEGTSYKLHAIKTKTDQLTFTTPNIVDADIAVAAGYTTKTYTVTDGTDGIAQVLVLATTDAAGANVVDSGYTNDNGTVLLTLQTGTTYYIWRRHANYTFADPDIEVA